MKQHLTTMALANRYGVSVETVRHWVNWKDWPEDCRVREGRDMLWHAGKVDAWLRTRRIGARGQKPRWLSVVGHPLANETAP